MLGKRSRYLFVCGLVLVTVACGGDDEAATTTAGPAATTAAPSTAAPTTATTTQPPEDPEAPAGEDRSGELLGRWEIKHYALPEEQGGGFTNVVGSDPVYIEFNADGTVDYSTGCNTGGTEYVASGTYYVPESPLDDIPEGQALTLGPSFEQTERGCEGFLGDQDRDLPANMAAVSRFRLDEDQLVLLDEFMLVEAVPAGS